MRYIVRNRLLWTLGAALVIFFAAALVLSVDELIEIARVSLMLTSVAAIGVYFPVWWPAMRYGKLDGPNRLGAGVALVACGVLGQTSYSYVRAILDHPEWMEGHPIVALWPMTVVMGFIMLLLAPSNEDESIQTRSWLIVGALSFIVGFASAILLATQWGQVFGLAPNSNVTPA